ncbi:hypothetical protein LZC94_23755 [Pendulispora albinea]|uniref:Uncharacterized protein n=1 Tax=Pendulispora albinea TaxID=2741071 RepID=A0ABZ2LNX5_9BACT
MLQLRGRDAKCRLASKGKRASHGSCVGPPVRLIEGESTIDHIADRPRNVWRRSFEGEWRSRRGEDERLVRRLGLVNVATGEKCEERGADSPDVGLSVDIGCSPKGLFGGHERGCSHGATGTCDRRTLVDVEEACNAEIEDANLSFAGDEKIVGLDIAMDDPGGVRRLQDIEQRVCDDDDLLEWQLHPRSRRARAQRFAQEQWHDEEGRAVFGDVIVGDGNDARVANGVREQRLAPKEALDDGVGGEPLVEDLDGDGVAVAVGAGVNGRHAADA